MPKVYCSTISRETKAVYDGTNFNYNGDIVVDKNGIASGFSVKSWINAPVSIAKASTSMVVIKTRWIHNTLSSDVAMIWELFSASGRKIRQEVAGDDKSTKILHNNTDTVGSIKFDTALVSGDIIDVEATVDFANNTFSETLVVNNNKRYTLNTTVSWASATYVTFLLGVYYSDSYKYPFDGGGIDLSRTKLLVDGYQILSGLKTITATTQEVKAYKDGDVYEVFTQ